MHKKTTNHIRFADGFSNSIKIFPLHSEKMTSPKKRLQTAVYPCYFSNTIKIFPLH